ncbi:hypothetical protein ABZ016_19895 [Streptomyces sp. NPDC006372]|uniref:hypothetical protein n=1 Tax=Streptomyces sp. NPDC006372 TaxID=3155599 RepID=UPI0033A393AE
MSEHLEPHATGYFVRLAGRAVRGWDAAGPRPVVAAPAPGAPDDPFAEAVTAARPAPSAPVAAPGPGAATERAVPGPGVPPPAVPPPAPGVTPLPADTPSEPVAPIGLRPTTAAPARDNAPDPAPPAATVPPPAPAPTAAPVLAPDTPAVGDPAEPPAITPPPATDAVHSPRPQAVADTFFRDLLGEVPPPAPAPHPPTPAAPVAPTLRPTPSAVAEPPHSAPEIVIGPVIIEVAAAPPPPAPEPAPQARPRASARPTALSPAAPVRRTGLGRR